jgi:hypothetical protein
MGVCATQYHSYKNARYPIPNDDIEQDREDMKHALMMELTESAHHATPALSCMARLGYALL